MKALLPLALCLLAVMPLVSANPVPVSMGPSSMGALILTIIIVPLLVDFIVLKLALRLAHVRPASFAKLLAALWLLGYVADAIVIWLIPTGAGLMRGWSLLPTILAGYAVSLILILAMDYAALKYLFKFGKRPSIQISAMMGALTNMFILMLLIFFLF